MSNNSFDISGDLVRIHTADGMFHAVASIRDDYRDELMSVTWGKNGKYFYNAKLGYLCSVCGQSKVRFKTYQCAFCKCWFFK